MPPWLAAREGHIGEANRIIAVVWPRVPLAHYGSLFEKGQSYANNVAAMPSLHGAYALLIALYLWRLVPRWARVPLALYPVAMAFALIYTGEHYAVDIARRLGVRGRDVRQRERVLRLARSARSGAGVRTRAGLRRLMDVRPLHFCDVTVDGALWPVFGWAIDTESRDDPRRHRE